MNIFNINWNLFSDNLLPLGLRNLQFREWIRSLLRPIKQLHLNFLNYRDHCLYRIKHNSQISYMEAVLNDLFDSGDRRIRIVNTVFKEPIYFYEPEEQREVFHYEPDDNRPVYYREPDDFAGEGVDFIVCVPPDLRPATTSAERALLTRMSGQIEYYKLYSKNYKIVWVQVNI